MSIVLGTITKDFAVITGDKRATEIDGRFHDDITKIFKVNDLLIGFTGSYRIVEVLMLSDIYETISNYHCADTLIKHLSETLLEFNGEESNILILGKNNDGKPKLNLMSPGDSEYESYEVENIPNSAAVTSPFVNHKDFQHLLINSIGGRTTIEDSKSIHKRIVKKASKIDKTVSVRCENLAIKFN